MTKQTLTATIRRTILSLALAATAAGCAVQDDIDSRTSRTGTPSDPVDHGTPPPSAVECAQACDRLFGGSAGDGAPDGLFDDENDCFQQCESGALGSLIDCVLDTPTGAIARVCFADEDVR